MSKNSSRLNELGIELYDAIDKDNLHKVGEILNQSFPLDHVFDGCTPLEYSIEKGNVTAVRLLLLKGASAEFGVSSHPLETAILSGRADIVVELLRTGVDTNQELNEEGWTFLIVASNVGILDTVKLLLQYKADANAVTKTGISALSQAAERGYKEIYEYLYAYSNSYILEKAKNKLEPGLLNRYRRENILGIQFIQSSGYGDIETLKEFLKLGVDINIVNDRGFGALYFAARHNKLETVKFLVSCGAKLDLICEADGTTPLMEAAQLGNDSIVRFLIESGADIKVRDFEGNTAMSHAQRRNYSKIIKYLQISENIFE